MPPYPAKFFTEMKPPKGGLGQYYSVRWWFSIALREAQPSQMLWAARDYEGNAAEAGLPCLAQFVQPIKEPSSMDLNAS